MYIASLQKSKQDQQLTLNQLAELDAYESEMAAEETRRAEIAKEMALETAKENAKEAEAATKSMMKQRDALKEQMEQEWAMNTDEDTGKVYYVSKTTGQSQWETPLVVVQNNQLNQQLVEAQQKMDQITGERDAALLAVEEARKASRDAEVAAVKKLDAVSARYKWREKKAAVAELQQLVDRLVVDLEVEKTMEKQARTVLETIAHEYKMLKTSSQVWEKKILWEERLDATSGEWYYVNNADGSTTWDKPESLAYYMNRMTSESTWDAPLCVQEMNRVGGLMQAQEQVVKAAQATLNQVLSLLDHEKDKLLRLEEFASMVKSAAREAANSKASQLVMSGDRSERMKNVLSRIRKRAIEGPVCYDCHRKRATRRCLSCTKPYCASCFNRLHSEGAMAGHSFLPIGKGSGLVGAGVKSAKTGLLYDKAPTTRAPQVLQCMVCTSSPPRPASYVKSLLYMLVVLVV
jgi:uncharacterized protein YjiS (DUF1127 family)